jgi:pSer/pThr/pTyr-binding forkhead associated (FHA) protein
VTEFGANEHRESEVESTLRFNDDFVQPDEEQLSADEQAAVDALPAGSALLIVKRGPNTGARFLLDQDLTTVGRHPNADIFLDDVTVSRRHAEFKRNGNDFEIVDLASLNGTYFDGSRVDQAKLNDGSELQIGKFHLTFFVAKAKN